MHESSGPNEEAKGISHQVLIIRLFGEGRWMEVRARGGGGV